jgi:hypothetical protein
MKCCLLVAAFVLSAIQTGLAQSQTGSNFGTLYSGSAASRLKSGNSSYVHTRRRRDDSDDQSSGSGNSGGGGNGGGREIDARDAAGSAPVARQASTPR